MSMEENVLVIDRSKWRTGKDGLHATGTGITALLNEDNYMCCLGFECIRQGLTSDKILNKGEPAQMLKVIQGLTYRADADWFTNTIFTTKAIHINDDQTMSREEREKQISEHFATREIQVEFIGEYTSNK